MEAKVDQQSSHARERDIEQRARKRARTTVNKFTAKWIRNEIEKILRAMREDDVMVCVCVCVCAVLLHVFLVYVDRVMHFVGIRFSIVP